MLKPWESDRRRRHPDDARTKMERWIFEQGGVCAVGKMLGVHTVTVTTWLGRRAIPSLEMAHKLITLSGGALTTGDILEASRPW